MRDINKKVLIIGIYMIMVLGFVFQNHSFFKSALIELNGNLLKVAGVRGYYNNTYNLYVSSDYCCYTAYEEATTDYETEQIIDFYEYLCAKDINLLYFSEPGKYTDDESFEDEFCVPSYMNRNVDSLLSNIAAYGIECVDLRTRIFDDYSSEKDLFYRTDHHWTVPASKWAAKELASELNDRYGYSIDLSIYDDNKYMCEEYSDIWLGEQGRLLSKEFIGLDDYSVLLPNWDTSFSVYPVLRGNLLSGDFGIFVDSNIINQDYDYRNGQLLHYVYDDYSFEMIHNNDVEGGNILILGDSYQKSMAPFLSLGVENLMVVCMRECKGSIRELIDNIEFDTVVIAYSPLSIGAYEHSDSDNYRMFDFE